MTTKQILENAKGAKLEAMLLDTEKKNNTLLCMADKLIENTEKILAANEKDVENARGVISDVMIDRLSLTEERIAQMADGIRQVALLPDPVGRVLEKTVREDGLLIEKTAVPIGVTAIIYESRPNVTSDAAALSLKSGNVCVLRGGKEAFLSASAIVDALREGLREAKLSENLINLIEDTTRQSASDLMQAVGYVDLLIPRGGKGLITACLENAKVPCIQTGTGICHIYVDDSADFDMALKIINNAKTSRPSVCNAAESLIVHKNIAKEFLPLVKNILCDEREKNGLTPVELRCDEASYEIIGTTKAGADDFDTEFLDYILAVSIADDVRNAIEHISKHSTGHSECIISENSENIALFTSAVDSSAVYVNASTRFTDGGEFGLGCEMGISTQKLHARGPMGLCELTTYKYIVKGEGHIR
ncbi:MAG: glutamate-5-semialdehyde dehydrogenase [Clostridia bacterium]|nr:glutamate-5-semialdehyde dehydrogenase [Clostridia bacterium]